MAMDQTDGERPSGYTIDGTPWEEPRGPHLPGVITRLPMFVWPFLALAALIGAQDVARVANLPSATTEVVIRSGIGAIPPVATVLLGAAWFWRLGDRTLRSPMAAGVTLLALSEGMRFASSWVIESATSLGGSGDDPFETFRWGGIWSTLEGVVSVVAILCLFKAFAGARRRPAAPGQRAATTVVALLAIAAIGVQLWYAWTVAGYSDNLVFPTNLSASLLAIVSVVASAVVTAVLVAGALAGEAPVIAWRLGAIGFLLPWLTSILGWLAIAGGSSFQDFFVPYQWVLIIVLSIGAIALLAAVALGLPPVEPIPDTPRSASAAEVTA
jgi:hypothetical protein